MAQYESRSLEEMVNTRGTKLWTQMNDNSKSIKARNQFVQDHGGFFRREGRYWKWITDVATKNGYWLKRVETEEKVFFSNMGEFATANGMTSSKICELLNGTRKTYKGWTAVEIRPIMEVGPRVKLKEPVRKKVIKTKSTILVDMTTNQVIPVTNLKEFARNNNLSYGGIKSLVNGKIKTHKNFKLYNPLAEYKDSSEPK
jgi:hypothetical protein